MGVELLVAAIAAVVALASAAMTAITALRVANLRSLTDLRVASAQQADEIAFERTRIENGLSRSVFELQSRIYNIVNQNFIRTFLYKNERMTNYVIYNTLYVIMQYFCWVEISHRSSEFLKSTDHKHTIYQDKISSIWKTDKDYGLILMIFSGEQRMLGEELITQCHGKSFDCAGFRDFIKNLPAGDPTIEQIKEQIPCLSSNSGVRERLVAIQHNLIDYLSLLDPDNRQFQSKYKSKI